MYHRTVISSFAAVAIGMSCMTTDASARGGGGGGVGGRSGVVTAPAPGVRSNITGPAAGGGYFAASGVRATPNITGVRGTVVGGGRIAASGVRAMPRITGVGGQTPDFTTGVLGPPGGSAAGAAGGGVAAGARYYAPASYNSNAACGRYPYPPCNGVPAR